ncbi:hypothetical protein MHYP_G00348110 [Metynnis hypsauchen]
MTSGNVFSLESGKDYISHEASSAALAVEGGRGAEIGGRRERERVCLQMLALIGCCLCSCGGEVRRRGAPVLLKSRV